MFFLTATSLSAGLAYLLTTWAVPCRFANASGHIFHRAVEEVVDSIHFS